MTFNKIFGAIGRGLDIFLALIIVIFSKNASMVIIDLDDAKQEGDADHQAGYENLLTEAKLESCSQSVSLKHEHVVHIHYRKEKLA